MFLGNRIELAQVFPPEPQAWISVLLYQNWLILLRVVLVIASYPALREVVKTALHARDPLLRWEAREETMGLPGLVGGWGRHHGSPRLGGGGGRDHGSPRPGEWMGKRPWVSQAWWVDGEEGMALQTWWEKWNGSWAIKLTILQYLCTRATRSNNNVPVIITVVLIVPIIWYWLYQ